jgi:hypothetical protein
MMSSPRRRFLGHLVSTRRIWHRRAAISALGLLLAGLVVVASSAPAGASTTWLAVPSPNNGTNGSELTSVSCDRANSCSAVGYYYTSMGVSQTLIESWNGTSWSIVPSPNNGTSNNELNGVSCVSTTSCSAVGYYDTSMGVSQTLVESWNGTSWSIVPSPNNGTSNNELNGVSCVSTTSCSAVGYYDTSMGVSQTLVESWNGTSWSVVPSPNNGTSNNELNGVSCVSVSSCKAVGSVVSTGIETLIESWNGRHWSIAASPPTGVPNNLLSGVSCASRSRCEAVGTSFIYAHVVTPEMIYTLIEAKRH